MLKLVLTLRGHLLTGLLVATLHFSTPLFSSEQPEWLIVGSTHNYGYAMAHTLSQKNISCRILVPEEQHDDALTYFGNSPHVEIAVGCSAQHYDALTTAASGCKYIFWHPDFESYAAWQDNVVRSVQNCIAAASEHNACIITPGFTYPFGSSAPIITKSTPYNPSSTQGRLMYRCEKHLKDAAIHNRCTVRIIRSSYSYGPNFRDYLTTVSFQEIPVNGRFTWLFRSDKPIQFSYSCNIAELAYHVAHEENEKSYDVILYPGTLYDSVDDFGSQICQEAGTIHNTYLISRWQLTLASLIFPNAQRGNDIAYAFQNPPILASDPELSARYPNFTPKTKHEAFRETLKWFQNNTVDATKL